MTVRVIAFSYSYFLARIHRRPPAQPAVNEVFTEMRLVQIVRFETVSTVKASVLFTFFAQMPMGLNLNSKG
jgi:hypothetical protein